MAAGNSDGHAFWIALAAAVAFVFAQDGGRKFLWRMSRAFIAGGLGYAAAVTDVFPSQNPVLVAVVVTAFSQPLLETFTAVIGDVTFIKDAIRERWFKK